MIVFLAFLFVLSGASGLIYESIWTRYLGLFVGHSAYAQIVVLVIFLGGMSLGAFLVGRRSSRLARPLIGYAVVELLVGVIGFFFHDIFVAVTGWAYASAFPALAGGAGVSLVKWGIAGLLILPQSVLLGATFPLMSAGAIRISGAQPGRTLSVLYFANSLGAAGGVLLAGFVLLERYGLPGTLLTAALLNFAVALTLAVVLRARDRGEGTLGVRPSGAFTTAEVSVASEGSGLPYREEEGTSPSPMLRALWGPLLIVTFGTAVASFIYEIAWVRMLSLALGSATHSFELMLSAFILGLSLGAFWVRSRADRWEHPVRVLGIVQWVMGTLAIATLPLYMMSFRWISWLILALRANDSGYDAFSVARYVICLVVMLPATFCAGITLPLITRMLLRMGAGERSIGQVYSVNTLGSIVGVALAGLLLMPLLGLKLLLVTGALVDIAMGALLIVPAVRQGLLPRRRTIALAAATLVFVIANAAFVSFEKRVLASGVYRHSIIPKQGQYTFPFYADGRTATVSVRKSTGDDGMLTLSTNGKPDASIGGFWTDTTPSVRFPLQLDLSTQVMLPLITLAHMPNAREAAVIGQGSGMTSHFLLGSPRLSRLATIEIEPAMIRGSRMFYPSNARVFDDPRSIFVLDDAKSYFAAANRKFDLIISEPSNPWVSGVSGLFTTEFYARVRGHLAPGGVFGQWLHLYELSDRLALSVVKAIDDNFPSYEVFFTSNLDILIVASNDAALPAPAWTTVLAFPGVAAELKRVVPLEAEVLEAMRLGGRAALHPYLETRGGPNSDFYPVLDLGAERTRFLHENADGFTSLSGGRFNLVAALTGRRYDWGTLALPVTPEIRRVSALALGQRLRAVRGSGAPVEEGDTALARAAYDYRALERELAGPAPLDWRKWLARVLDVEQDIHEGTAGVVDEKFYEGVRGFAKSRGAPSGVQWTLDFLHGTGTWNWAETYAAADSLIRWRDAKSENWLSPQTLREGAVVAALKLDHPDVAKKWLQDFGISRDDVTLRDRILAGFVGQALREKKQQH
ncbi:MAG: Spermine synthase [Gemmatimonadetes bacterium]|nr:Spermine synthase [Gemmatimonadota bacterium]